jgi:predicted nucleotide-binding protein (sugar kinase/HSP70/actin superfamily)
MSDCGAETLAAAFRSVGLDAVALPAPDAHTLELGSRHLMGDECLPAKVTLGDFLKVAEEPGFESQRVAFFLPASEGPCRLGQYSPQIRSVFRSLGWPEVLLISPTDSDGYHQAGILGADIARRGWWAIVTSDILRKLLLKTRPYEKHGGDADRAYSLSLQELCAALEISGLPSRYHVRLLKQVMIRIRDRFRAIPARYKQDRLFIGIQGEIFCRMEDFSNGHLIRHLEACGAEAWLSDISEWIWYSNCGEEERLRHAGCRYSFGMARAKLRDYVQRSDQHTLHVPFIEDFQGQEEPADTETLLRAGHSYLPFACTEGEMVLSAGKVNHFFQKGVDGILDVSPFSCMNGIVSEALYPRVSRDHAGLPIKNIYLDGTGRDLTSDLEVFLELARVYQRRKPHARRYPKVFQGPYPAPAVILPVAAGCGAKASWR